MTSLALTFALLLVSSAALSFAPESFEEQLLIDAAQEYPPSKGFCLRLL
jgi:hypothetical protein